MEAIVHLNIELKWYVGPSPRDGPDKKKGFFFFLKISSVSTAMFVWRIGHETMSII